MTGPTYTVGHHRAGAAALRVREDPPTKTAGAVVVFGVCWTCYLRMLTARAMTKARVASEIRDCPSMVSLAHRDRGMTSVGLKAVALVKER